jgi:hypothetical protein
MNWRAAKAAQRLERQHNLRNDERAARSGRDSRFPFFEIPHWVVQLVIVRIVIGLLLLESLREYGA